MPREDEEDEERDRVDVARLLLELLRLRTVLLEEEELDLLLIMELPCLFELADRIIAGFREVLDDERKIPELEEDPLREKSVDRLVWLLCLSARTGCFTRIAVLFNIVVALSPGLVNSLEEEPELELRIVARLVSVSADDAGETRLSDRFRETDDEERLLEDPDDRLTVPEDRFEEERFRCTFPLLRFGDGRVERTALLLLLEEDLFD